MTGPKLNEKSFVAGERSGTKATARYVRASASKARVVLDLIRGLDVASAPIRCCSSPIATSPVTSARCSPAPSPTPSTTTTRTPTSCSSSPASPTRARRSSVSAPVPAAVRPASTSVRCHITVIVARMSDDRIAVIQARQERAGGTAGRGRPQSSAASRRARVERSRKKASPEAAAAEQAEVDTEIAVAADEQDVVDTTAELAADVETEVADTETVETEAADEGRSRRRPSRINRRERRRGVSQRGKRQRRAGRGRPRRWC